MDKKWTIEQWLGIMLIVFIFVLGLGTGFGLGRVGREVKIQIEEKEKIVKRPYLDLTLPKEKQLQRLNAYANTLDLEVLERGTEHKIWQSGYKEGYKSGRAR